MKLESIAISCGGTGGHFYPGLAVALEAKKEGKKVILLVGGKNAPKQCKMAEDLGVEAVRIPASPLSIRPRSAFAFLRDLLPGIFLSMRKMKEDRIQSLLCMGSFTSLPPAIGARFASIPLFLHDGNARLGKANKFLSRWAKLQALAFPSPDEKLLGCPAFLTGMPLRPELLEGFTTKEKALEMIKEKWGIAFDPARPVILAFGGSLGAASLNEAVASLGETFPEEKIQLIHLAGPGKTGELGERYKKSLENFLLLEGTGEMALLYSAADLVISRAGGSTVAECAIAGKYTILIPYPHAAENHQQDNALFLAETGGAEILKDDPSLKGKLSQKIKEFFSDPASFREKGALLQKKAFPEAAAKLLTLIEENLSPE